MSDPDAILVATSKFTGVAQEFLELFTLPPARTTFISDRATFFGKVLAHDGENEVTGAKYAEAHGIKTATYIGDVYLPDGQRLVFFEYLSGPINFNENPFSILEQIWNIPVTDNMLRLSLDVKRGTALSNLTHDDSVDSLRIRRVLDELNFEYRKIEKEINVEREYWLHGDCHERNIFSYDGELLALDWEWHGRGQRELDVGKWLQTNIAESDLTNPLPLWNSAKEFGLFEDFIKLEIRTSAARAFSYQLRWKTRTDWLDKLYELAVGDNVYYKLLQ